MATVKPNWKLPPPPKDICDCGAKIIPCVLNTGDGWALLWDCENFCAPFDDDDGCYMFDVWPFVENTAKAKDFEDIGFTEL